MNIDAYLRDPYRYSMVIVGYAPYKHYASYAVSLTFALIDPDVTACHALIK